VNGFNPIKRSQRLSFRDNLSDVQLLLFQNLLKFNDTKNK